MTHSHNVVPVPVFHSDREVFLTKNGLAHIAFEAPECVVLHLCGAFHCAHGLGIPEALPRYCPQCLSLAMFFEGSASGAL